MKAKIKADINLHFFPKSIELNKNGTDISRSTVERRLHKFQLKSLLDIDLENK